MTLPSKPKILPYLTVVPGRHPENKMHTSLGHAKNAVQVYPRSGGWRSDPNKGWPVCGGQVYRWDYEIHDWELLYDIEPGSWQADLPWKGEK